MLVLYVKSSFALAEDTLPLKFRILFLIALRRLYTKEGGSSRDFLHYLTEWVGLLGWFINMSFF